MYVRIWNITTCVRVYISSYMVSVSIACMLYKYIDTIPISQFHEIPSPPSTITRFFSSTKVSRRHDRKFKYHCQYSYEKISMAVFAIDCRQAAWTIWNLWRVKFNNLISNVSNSFLYIRIPRILRQVCKYICIFVPLMSSWTSLSIYIFCMYMYVCSRRHLYSN